MKHSIFTSAFWADAAERSISTFAQAAIGVLTAGAVGVVDVDWASVGSVAGLATLVALLKAIAKASPTPEPTSSARHAA